jgi:hypothetical protein
LLRGSKAKSKERHAQLKRRSNNIAINPKIETKRAKWRNGEMVRHTSTVVAVPAEAGTQTSPRWHRMECQVLTLSQQGSMHYV